MKKMRHLLWLWLAVVMLAMPQSMKAEDYFQAKYTSMCFLVTPNGPGCLHIKVMHLDVQTKNGYIEKTDAFPDGAWVYMKVGDKRRNIVALYNNGNNESSSSDYSKVYIRAGSPAENEGQDCGILVLTNDRYVPEMSRNGVSYKGNLIPSGEPGVVYNVKKPKGSGVQCMAEFDWYYPTEFAGQEAHFYIRGSVAWGDDLNDRELGGSPQTLTAKPDIYISDPIFMPTGANIGYYSMIVSNTTGEKLRLQSVMEQTGDGSVNKDITKECKTSDDGLSLLIPAVDHTRKVIVSAQTPYNTYRFIDLKPKEATLDAFHNPKDFNLTASWGENGSTVLKWTVPNADQKDALPTDVMIVERQLYDTSKPDSVDVWKVMDQVVMESSKSNYEYIDNTVGCYGTEKYNSVRYRISRATVGKLDGYTCTSEMPNKRGSISGGRFEPRDVEVVDGKVKLTWFPIGSENNGTQSFLPEGWKLRILRTSYYYKGGMEVSNATELDVTDKFTNKNADGLSEFIDEDFASCTQYSYSLVIYPNDPAGVMKRQEKPFEKNGRQVKVEPVTDDSKVGNFTASYDEFDNHIHVQWKLDMQRIDDLKLKRLVNGNWENVEIDPQLRYYDDYDVEAGVEVKYRLSASYECMDGMHTLTPDDMSGRRRATGKIAGFLTFKDGTGLADVEVQLLRDDEGGEVLVETVKTSTSGAYIFPRVPYSDRPYIVRPKTSLYPDLSPTQYPVYLNKKQTEFFNKDFISDDAFDIDGYVYYEKTTVPVHGASFKIDGQDVVDKSGNIVTSDNDGHFSFKARKGSTRLTVQKEGHTFMFNGLYADNNGKARPINSNQTNVFFWDQTKVHTIGRVVGGLDQGDKTLGFGLSKNNLGDDLRIVLELEGNQRSWLVKDQLNDALTVVYDTLTFDASERKETSTVITERHRVIISPNAETGEYQADLLPVRYKVVEVSANGYPSLFQRGKVSEVLDLTDSLSAKTFTNEGKKVSYNATYNRIYRIEPSVAIVELDVESGEELPYVGDASYVESSVAGNAVTVPLYDERTKTYTFGYPVLRTGKHNFRVKATENYYYNGDRNGACDSVPLRGGRVRIYDDFAAVQSDTLRVLSTHTGSVDFKVDVQNTVYDVQGTNALRHLDVTLEHEGQFIDGQNLKAFVMGYQKITDDVLSGDGIIEVVDVLRDPPGSKSYSWVDAETTYHSEFNFAIGASFALKLGLKQSSGTDLMSGAFAGSGAGTWMGTQTTAETDWSIAPKSIPLVGFELTHKGSVDFQLNERVQTSDDPAYVGADADVYCGYELVAAASAVRNVRAVNEATYLYLKEANLFSEEDGACHLIAEGKTDAGIPYYLISDYNYQVGPKIKSNFAYSQKYILETLLPKLRSMRNSYIYKGTRAQAQAKANATLRNVFFSLLPEDDPRYGQDNLDESYEYISIDRYDELHDRLNYEVITPEYVKVLKLEKQMAESVSATDSVRIMNRKIAQWEYVIARNEYEKVQAFAAIDEIESKRGDMDYKPGTPYNVDKKADFYLENHSISGGTTINHNETFDSSNKWNFKLPILGFDVTDWSGDQGMQYFNNIVNGGLSIASDGLSDNVDWKKKWKETDPSVTVSWKKKNDTTNQMEDKSETISGDALKNMDQLQNVMKKAAGGTDISIKTGGSKIQMSIEPELDFTYESNNDSSTDTKTYRGYQLETDGDSHLSIDVYHDIETVAAGINVFGAATEERKLSQSNYIFRTVGGATKCPYEGEEVTKIYAPGTQLSAATAYVEKPRITVEKHVVSGVPYGETAKFNLVLSNEGTVRQEGSFDLVLLDKTNQTGASLVMDGAPLGNGRSLVVPFGTGMVKVLELGQGLVDDYENIRLILRSQCDPSVADTVSLSVHFVPSASPIAVVTPQDKWVLNTNSAQDERGRYYMPVTIGGYDVNFRNFDHVELQYKQSSEPESRWTNLCSYYNEDSLYQKGVGTKSMLTGGTLTHAFYGDSDPVELKYDLRAVTYSRLGNDFVTNSSPVFSGIKDTRRPQIFGSPLPANGILGVGDDLKLTFSEDINANRLLATNNFKVTGMPNNSVIGTTTYLYLEGDNDSYLETERDYSISDDDFTIDMMVKIDPNKKRDCYLLEHTYENSSTKGLSIGLKYANGESYLVVYVKQSNLMTQQISAKLENMYSNFQRIVVVYNKDERTICIYQNNKRLIRKEVDTRIPGILCNGKMRFGRLFAGNLMETRVWSKALTADEIEETASKSMYGNEVDLVAYYPMNEGYGKQLEDKVLDNHLTVNQAEWVTPAGGSFVLTGKHSEHELKREMFERTSADKSYTLGLWFKAAAQSNFPIMASGYGVKDEANASEKLFIGVKKDKLTISCDTTSIVMNKSYADNEWHQLTFVVNRSSNIASAYVDGELTGQAQAAGFGKLYGATPFCLGQLSVWKNETPLESFRYMQGNIDEITLWDMALPGNVVKQRMNESHDGEEAGLLAYIPFNEDVKQITGSGTQVEFSTKYFSNKWDTELQKMVATSDEAFGNGSVWTDDMKTMSESAAVKAKGAVRDLRFDFVTKDNEMIIELKELPKDIDRTTVNITAMGIEDMNGNEMAQPVTWSAFIDRNSVRWAESQKIIEIDAEKEGDYTFTVDINNHGGAFRTYTIESLADWMTVEEGTMGTLDPEETRTLHITISKDINIGTYNDVVYLKNDEGLSNPLFLTITKRGATPNWTYNKNTQSNMQLIAQVKMGDTVVTNKENILAAFDEYDKCLGKGHVTIDQNGKALFYLTVYGERKNSEVFFRMWDAASGITYGLTPDGEILYMPDTILASYDNPVVMTANSNMVRSLELVPTWTWVSLNVASQKASDVNLFLKHGTWQDGDQLKDPEAQAYYNYRHGVWNGNGVTEALRTDRMYYIKSQKAQTINLEGRALIEEADRTITLHPKWNYIGYTPMVNLPVNEALEDLKDKASDGDIIKSQDEFATFAASVGGWRGNLQYMKPGKGYMLYHQVTAEHPEEVVKFVYPFAGTSAVSSSNAREIDVEDDEPLWTNTRSTTMNMIVRTEGIAAEEGDRLYAYADGDLCGIAEAMDVDGEPTFFLSVGGEEKKELTFTLERNGEYLGAATRAGIMYQADRLEGTTAVPKVIDFSETTVHETGVWYTLTGIRVGERRPTAPGVYIFNGQRVAIK